MKPDQDSADLLRAVIGALSEGLAVFDEDTTLIFCNEAYKACNPLFADIIAPGLRYDVMLREAVARNAISADLRERIDRLGARVLNGEPNTPPLECELSNGAVHEITMRLTASGGIVVTQRDITERRRYEESEREAEAILGKVLEACPANLVMSRVGDGRVLYRSPAATQLLGPIRSFHEHFTSREERADFVTALLPDGRVDEMPVTARRPDGSTFPCLLSARLIDYRGEDVMVSSTVDISRDVALRKTLAEQREQLFQAEKMSALGELLAGVAHELNNPLSVVVGHALMLREEAADPEMQRRIEKISAAAERCARIVKSFLAMAREQPVQLAPTDVRETVEMAVEALTQGADGLATPVRLDIPDDLPSVLADSHQIAQVIINLVTNADQAIRAAGAEGIIHINARHNQEIVEISVVDNGPGVPAGIRNRIFDPLFTTKEVGKGTGIGLAFCHRVLTAHNGYIRLDETREGASFTIGLPIAGETASEAHHEASGADEFIRARVLVVDDEPEVAGFIGEVLSREGLAVDSAESAEAALALIQTHAYALILTDLNMPGMGGKGLFEALSKDNPALAARIGFITGDTMSAQARRFLDESGRPCLEKPVSPADLRQLVRQMAGAAP